MPGAALWSWVPVPNVLSLLGIRQLQLLLLKVALLLGVEIHWGVTFTGLQPPPKKGKYFSAPENRLLPRTSWHVEEIVGWASAESPFLIVCVALCQLLRASL